MYSASSRAPRSPIPPAANPVTMRTGLLGQSCAEAARGTANTKLSSASPTRIGMPARAVICCSAFPALSPDFRRAPSLPARFLVAGLALLGMRFFPSADRLRFVVVHFLIHADAVLPNNGIGGGALVIVDTPVDPLEVIRIHLLSQSTWAGQHGYSGEREK